MPKSFCFNSFIQLVLLYLKSEVLQSTFSHVGRQQYTSRSKINFANILEIIKQLF